MPLLLLPLLLLLLLLLPRRLLRNRTLRACVCKDVDLVQLGNFFSTSESLCMVGNCNPPHPTPHPNPLIIVCARN